MGRCSKYSNYLPLPHFLIGIVNFPNGNFDNFDLRPPRIHPFCIWEKTHHLGGMTIKNNAFNIVAT